MTKIPAQTIVLLIQSLEWEGELVAESNITKRALASAFKELIEDRPFSKISIGDICEKCELNRKSFYYHFKDKYDLVNWIYYTEFITKALQKEYILGWDLLEDLCVYFYKNQNFYRKIFNVIGQNSFSEYFHEVIDMIVTKIMKKIGIEEDSLDFYVDFYSDAFFCAIKRWILASNCMPADIFVEHLKKCLFATSNEIVSNLTE